MFTEVCLLEGLQVYVFDLRRKPALYTTASDPHQLLANRQEDVLLDLSEGSGMIIQSMKRQGVLAASSFTGRAPVRDSSRLAQWSAVSSITAGMHSACGEPWNLKPRRTERWNCHFRSCNLNLTHAPACMNCRVGPSQNSCEPTGRVPPVSGSMSP